MSDLSFALQHLNPTNFHHALWKKSIRADGRTFEQIRHISTKQGSTLSPNSVLRCYLDIYSNVAIGSSMIKWGGTIVSCGIVPEIGVPSFATPECGDIGRCFPEAMLYNMHSCKCLIGFAYFVSLWPQQGRFSICTGENSFWSHIRV